MAAVASLGSTVNTTGGNKTVTATPTVDDLIVVVQLYADTAEDAVTVSDDNSDGLGTYTQVANLWSTTPDRAAGIYIRNAFIGSATSTVFTRAVAGDLGGGLQVFRVTGMSRVGAAAARQVATQVFAAAGTPTPVLAAAALTENALIGIVANASNPAGVTPRTSWTESVDTGFATPTTGAETMFIDNGETASSIAWGSTSASFGVCAVVELDTSVPPTGGEQAFAVVAGV